VVGLPCTRDGRDLLDKRLQNCSKCLDIYCRVWQKRERTKTFETASAL
jgi:hypothetical protein